MQSKAANQPLTIETGQALANTGRQEAKRLLKFLDYFVGVPIEDIPKNSILREFVGGSCFDV